MVNQNNSNKPSNAEGISVYGFSSIKNISITVDPTYVFNLMSNPYAASPISTLRSTTFIGPPTIKVKDPEGEINEDLTNEYRHNALDINKVDYKAIQAWEDGVYGGSSVFSAGTEKKNGKVVITQINHLPWYSFNRLPSGRTKEYNPIMPGITYNEQTKTVEVYQCETLSYGTPKQIKNFFIIKDPAKAEPAGESEMVPVIPVLASIDLADKAENQRVNRVGAPNVFIQYTDEMMGDTERQYLEAFSKKWGKDVGYILPPTCRLLDGHLMESGAAIERLEFLKNLIGWYWYPTDAVSTRDGTLIGGSDAGATQVLLNSISYKLSYIEAAFEDLYNENLKANGYENYTIEIKFPRPNIDKSELILKSIDIGIKGKSLLPSEIRANLPDLNLKELDENELSELSSFYAQATPFGNTVEINNASAPQTGNKEANKLISKAEDNLSKATTEYQKTVGETIWEDENFQKYNKESEEPIDYVEFMRTLMREA